MRLAVGSDHAGLLLKEVVVQWLRAWGHEVTDLGAFDATSVDYPDYAHAVATALEEGAATRGVLVCGTGLGMSMSANRHSGIRAALCTDAYSASMARAHNDANVLCLGARVVGTGVAESILRAFVQTEFEGGRHEMRVRKIERSVR